MSQPVWITPAENLGTFPSGRPLNLQFVAQITAANAVSLEYTLLNGQLPDAATGSQINLSRTGLLTGIPKNISEQTTYKFTIRVTDNLGNFRDRTFSFDIFGFNGVYIATGNGLLVNTFDSTYIDYQIQVNNPVDNNPYRLTISSGSLPPGLYLDELHRIRGYALPPTNVNGSPVARTFTFSLQLTSDLGLDSKTYNIRITNQQLSKPINSRKPAILNNTPLIAPVPLSDPYLRYYIPENNIIPTIKSGEFFSFKIIGHDFDNQPLSYNFGVLPQGLTGNSNTGWITGTPNIAANSIAQYQFSVQVSKASNPGIFSQTELYTLTISNDITQEITWKTDSDLGIVFNGSISELYVEANSEYELEYSLIGGTLPPNIELLSNGQLAGRFPYQSQPYLQSIHETSEFSFIVQAFYPRYPIVSSEKTFTITIKQEFENPLDTIYFKACPNIEGRRIIQSLLTDETLIPTENLYRPSDSNFGKASDVKYMHIYGLETVNIEKYIEVIGKNHYNRKLVLGEIKTAIARDSNNNIAYEVVYSEIVDDLINSKGQSIPQEIIWPTKISLDEGPYFVSKDNYFTSSENLYTSYTPGSVRILYPASLTNMRNEVLENLTHSTNQNLLPKWMTSQQVNGNTLGFIQAWVICYTLPGYSETIKNNINNNWEYKLNMIDFSIDRMIIDKSASYNYNTQLLIPSWIELPGASPTPDPLDRYDLPVLFPRKTILPKNVD